jgi:hypothetical protein
MVGLGALWLPILLSSVVVFIASSLIHMALKYHATDFSGMPGEAAVAEAMRRQGVGPGNYMIPHCGSHAEARTPENLKRFEDGPVGVFMIAPRGMPNMGRHLTLWFLYTVAIGFMVAYVASRTLAPGAEYLTVFRLVGTVAFLAYAGSEPVQSIWKFVHWSTTAKLVLDGLIYGLLTAGVFGWLWPN